VSSRIVFAFKIKDGLPHSLCICSIFRSKAPDIKVVTLPPFTEFKRRMGRYAAAFKHQLPFLFLCHWHVLTVLTRVAERATHGQSSQS
jgi:hypothetical protein